MDDRIKDNTYEFRFDPQMIDYFGGQLLIGELTEVKSIVRVQVILYDADNNPLQFISETHDLGHLLDVKHPGYAFFSVRCLLELRASSPFNPRSLFFHFARLLSTSASTSNESKDR